MDNQYFGIDLGQGEGDHVINLDQSEQNELQALLKQVIANPYKSTEEFILQANLTFHELPRRIRDRIINFQRYGNIEGAMLLRGLPVDVDLPITPPDAGRSLDKTSWASEFWGAVFSTPLGELIAYAQEKNGEIFQNICPTPKNEKMLSSESSKILLDFHTEVAFHPFMPDYVLLYCLRQDHKKTARTLVASIRKIYPLLTSSQREILGKPVFETGIDFSFGSPNGKRGGGLSTPVLYGNTIDPYIRFDPDLMVGRTPEATALLDVLKDLANQVADYVCLQAGDLLLIDNKRAVHGRTEFVPKYDGSDRWLQRLFVIRDLTSSAADRNKDDRVIRTEFTI